MFMDFWCEIYESVKRKPSRTILTGIGISWGIFILIGILPATTVRKVGTILTFSDGWVILCRLRLTSFAVIQSLLQ